MVVATDELNIGLVELVTTGSPVVVLVSDGCSVVVEAVGEGVVSASQLG